MAVAPIDSGVEHTKCLVESLAPCPAPSHTLAVEPDMPSTEPRVPVRISSLVEESGHTVAPGTSGHRRSGFLDQRYAVLEVMSVMERLRVDTNQSASDQITKLSAGGEGVELLRNKISHRSRKVVDLHTGDLSVEIPEHSRLLGEIICLGKPRLDCALCSD
jgi:hypothetical protein